MSGAWGRGPWSAALAALVLGLMAVTPARATAGAATETLRPAVDEVLRILGDPALKGAERMRERRTALRAVMEGVIDFPDAAQRALALHWPARTPAERDEFVALFRDLVMSSYIVSMEAYAGHTVAFVAEAEHDGAVTVLTKVQGRQGPPVPVEYRMHARDGRWLVYDVVVEGVSLVANYRTQFNTVIRTASYPELVRRMRARVSELTGATVTSGVPRWRDVPPEVRLLSTVAPAATIALGAPVEPAASPALTAPPTFAAVVEAVAPAVVTIAASGRRPSLDADEDEEGAADERHAGSGVIIDPAGVVLTNAHVANGRDLEVVTADGRRLRPMRVAIDARSDLAVLVIGDGSTRFPHATLGDSDRVRVGDWVVAVGAPLGLQTTVTAGIVSSRARDSLGPEAPDYLLTSAALRFGNSGGPLVNMDGEVIGINTVFGFTSAGLAFTIPSNSARAVVPQLLATGRVRRAGLGLVTQRLTPDLAQALGTGTATGLLVADVIPGGPAAAAGLRPGDVLLSFEAQALRARTDLARALERAQPGRDVRLGVRERNGRERTVAVTLEQERDAMPTSLAVYRFPSLGFSVQTLTPDAGVVVNQVDERGAGGALRVGDLIREMNHVPVGGADEFARLADRLQPGRPVALLVQRGPLALYVAVTPRLPATARP